MSCACKAAVEVHSMLCSAIADVSCSCTHTEGQRGCRKGVLASAHRSECCNVLHNEDECADVGQNSSAVRWSRIESGRVEKLVMEQMPDATTMLRACTC